MDKKKILILANTFYPVLGGVETHLLDLIREISKEKNIEVHLIAYTYFGDKNNPYIGKYRNVKINLLKLCSKNPESLLNWLELNNYFFYFFYTIIPLFFYTFFYCLKNKNFDIVHANSHTTGVVAVLISKIFGIRKKYLSMHGIMFSKLPNFQKYNRFRKRIKKQFKKFDKIFCIGQRSYEEIKELMDGNSNNLELFRYWVDDRFFDVNKDKGATKDKLNLGDKKIIFYAGRLVETKGILILLEVAKELPQYNFVIAGSGILTDEVKEYSKKYENIKFLGKIENNLLPKYYIASDVSILLTQGDGEGIPRALIESIACGTPVVSTARGGTKELIDFGTGFIVENDIADIKNNIEMILGDEETYTKIQKNCYLVAKKYFSKQNAQMFIKSYEI